MRQIIGRPSKEPPDVLVRALRARCALHPEVERAFLFQTMLVEPTQPPSLGLGISVDDDAAPERAQEILADVAQAPNDVGYQEDLLFQVLTADALAIVARTVAPFYERAA
jgi:hypothetical protein